MVRAAPECQRRCLVGTGLLFNTDMGPAEVRDCVQVDQTGKGLRRVAMQQRPEGTQMSTRTYRYPGSAVDVLERGKSKGWGVA